MKEVAKRCVFGMNGDGVSCIRCGMLVVVREGVRRCWFIKEMV